MKPIPVLFAPLALPLLLALAACSVGPDYHRPAVADLPRDWRWRPAEPKDAAPKGPWWTVFHDPELDRLEAQAVARNTDLQAAVARVDQARAQARIEGAAFFPTLNFDPAYTREQIPADFPQFSKFNLPGAGGRIEPYNSFSVPLDLSYEVDLWGRVRRSFEAARAQAQATVADYHNVLLTLTSDVAVDYLALRAYDDELAILAETARSRDESVRINRTRVQAGRATELDVAQAETDATNARSDLAGVQKNRAETENALAVLCGAMASGFAVPVAPLEADPPRVPADLPATLLERRPDVASAERAMAAANAKIGVAYAAFFPTVTLTGQGGYLSARASDLFNWENSVWSIGPSISLPLFEGGRNVAGVKSARADYDQAVAQYRGAVLGAVKDVENALADLRFLAEQKRALDLSVASAHRATELATRRFRVGQANYTEVIVAQQTELASQRARAQTRGQLHAATVRLIKALGGGWNAAELGGEQPAPPPFGSQAGLGKT